MNYSKALTSSLPKKPQAPAPLVVSSSNPCVVVESETQRQERLKKEHEKKILEERRDRQKRLEQADRIRASKQLASSRTPTTNPLGNPYYGTTYTSHALGGYEDYHHHRRGRTTKEKKDDSPTGKFEAALRRYHRSLGNRLTGQEKYAKHMVDPLIDAIDQKMGVHDNEIYVMLCQQSAETMTRRFCDEHPIAEFDAALQSGAMTTAEAIGLLGFHRDTAGVLQLKNKYELSLETVDYRHIHQRGMATGCMTKDQLSDLGRTVAVREMLDLGFYGQAAFMGGDCLFGSIKK